MKRNRWIVFVVLGLLFYHVANLAVSWPLPAPRTPTTAPVLTPRPTLVLDETRRDPSIPILLPTLTPYPTRPPAPTVRPAVPSGASAPTATAQLAPAVAVTPSATTVAAGPPQPTPAATGETPIAVSPTAPEPTATPQPAREAVAAATVVHTVEGGETLTSIARQYGVPVEAIVEANDLSDPDVLKIGMTLVIPVAAVPLPTP